MGGVVLLIHNAVVVASSRLSVAVKLWDCCAFSGMGSDVFMGHRRKKWNSLNQSRHRTNRL